MVNCLHKPLIIQPPPTSIMLAVYELLPACPDESVGTEAMERTGRDNEMK